MGNFNLKDYSEVKDRIKEFYDEFPDGNITTHLSHFSGERVVMEARVYRTPDECRGGVYTSGFAHEIEGDGHVNKTSHVENCETSAIGRALANMNYGVSANRPSREEMIKVARVKKEHDAMVAFVTKYGAAVEDDAVYELDGEEVNIKDHIREHWADAKEQFLVARELVKMVEQESGEKFKV